MAADAVDGANAETIAARMKLVVTAIPEVLRALSEYWCTFNMEVLLVPG
jgi:hypothetical protein